MAATTATASSDTGQNNKTQRHPPAPAFTLLSPFFFCPTNTWTWVLDRPSPITHHSPHPSLPRTWRRSFWCPRGTGTPVTRTDGRTEGRQAGRQAEKLFLNCFLRITRTTLLAQPQSFANQPNLGHLSPIFSLPPPCPALPHVERPLPDVLRELSLPVAQHGHGADHQRAQAGVDVDTDGGEADFVPGQPIDKLALDALCVQALGRQRLIM